MIASPIAVPPPAWMRGDRALRRQLVEARRADGVGGVRERDDAHAEAGREALDEALRGLARGGDAIGVDVLREHRARAVEREHDGALLALGRDRDRGRAIPTASAASAASSSAGGTKRHGERVDRATLASTSTLLKRTA